MPYCVMYDSEYGESSEECVMCCLNSLCLERLVNVRGLDVLRDVSMSEKNGRAVSGGN